MDVRRGEIFYIMRSPCVGSEQEAGRPAVIVSNNKNNMYAGTAEVVYLTTQPKKEMPTHVKLNASGKGSTALCEQIHTIASERIGEYYGTCTDEEMKAIDEALSISIGIERTVTADESTIDLAGRMDNLKAEYERLKMENQIISRMYNNLIDKLVGGKA